MCLCWEVCARSASRRPPADPAQSAGRLKPHLERDSAASAPAASLSFVRPEQPRRELLPWRWKAAPAGNWRAATGGRERQPRAGQHERPRRRPRPCARAGLQHHAGRDENAAQPRSRCCPAVEQSRWSTAGARCAAALCVHLSTFRWLLDMAQVWGLCQHSCASRLLHDGGRQPRSLLLLSAAARMRDGRHDGLG